MSRFVFYLPDCGLTEAFHCSTSLREGIPPLILNSSAVTGLERDGMLSELPEDVRLRWKLHEVTMNSTRAITCALENTTSISPYPALSPCISLFDTQFRELLNQCRSTISWVWTLCKDD